MFSCRENKVREKRLTPPAYVPSTPRTGRTVTDDGTLFLAGLLRESENWAARPGKTRPRPAFFRRKAEG